MEVEDSKVQAFEKFQNHMSFGGIILTSISFTNYLLFFDKPDGVNAMKGLELIKRNINLLNLRRVTTAIVVGTYVGAPIGFYGGFSVGMAISLVSDLKNYLEKKAEERNE